MSDKEIERLIKVFEIHKNKLLKSKKASQDFLISTGIFTKTGKLTKAYKNLCTPPEQD